MTTYTATYSAEDNKLRLYASSRLDAETYAAVKAAGFSWAPRQELFVAPKWTPEREDLLAELAGEIEPEDMTLAERATAKAERLEALANKRNGQAVAAARHADSLSEAFYMGQPILIGHHSERKARKTQERMHAAMARSVDAGKAANYWLYRATGVEAFVNMKGCDRTRTNRIKTLLAELRDLQRGVNNAQAALVVWERFTTDEQIKHALGRMDSRVTLAGYDTFRAVETGELSPDDARTRCIANAQATVNGPKRRRWIAHLLARLAFERDMLGDVPRYDGQLTPVILQAFAREHGADKPTATATADGYRLESALPLPLHIADGCALDMSGDDWRDLMQETGYIVPAAVVRRVSSKPAPVALINPSREDAERLQALWNAQAIAKHASAQGNTVRAITQDRYSANSKGEYAPFKTIDVDVNGEPVRSAWRGGVYGQTAEPVARLRVYSGGMGLYGPRSVVTVTDKPSKPLPFVLQVAA